MALNGQNTSNFNLYKPSLKDSPPDITSTNANWDVIDTELKRLGDVGLPTSVNNKLPSAVASMEIKEVYLSPNGNDGASGTATAPLKTISTAIARFGGTARLILRFNSGPYTESNPIEVSGCSAIQFEAVDGAQVTINGVYIQHGGYFSTNRINFTTSSVESLDCITLNGTSAVIENATFSVKNTAVVFRFGSVGIVNACIFNNCARAIWAMSGSYVAATNISGSGNSEGYRTTASIISVGTTALEATIPSAKYGGGVIFRNGNLIGTTANTFVNAT